MTKFYGVTARSVRVEESTLDDCVKELAKLAGIDPGGTVSIEIGDSSSIWAVYYDAKALEIDQTRGPITTQSPGWFALVRKRAT